MRYFFNLYIKGVIIGIGKIIPGVSGSVLAMSLGIYEEAIKAINHFFKDISRHFKFLFVVGLGIITSVVLTSNIIKYFLNHFYLPTMLLFIGLIIGGISLFFKKIKQEKTTKVDIGIASIVFIGMIVISIFSQEKSFEIFNHLNDITFFLILGIIEAITMIVPGISGTVIFMLIGCYNKLIDFLSNLFVIDNFKILVSFGIGIVIGTLIVVKLIDYLLNKYKTKTYMAILGFTISSILLLFIQTLNNSYSFTQIIIGLLLLGLGYKIARKIN